MGITVQPGSESSNNFQPVIVHNCEDCPMFYDGRDSNDHDRLICNHPEAPYQSETNLKKLGIEPIQTDDSGYDMSYIEWVVTPDWCPLKAKPVIIIFSA